MKVVKTMMFVIHVQVQNPPASPRSARNKDKVVFRTLGQNLREVRVRKSVGQKRNSTTIYINQIEFPNSISSFMIERATVKFWKLVNGVIVM